MRKWMLFAALVAAGCGGKKHGDTVEGGGGDDDSMASGDHDPCEDSGGMCPPEKLQEIQSDLDRKRETATRCLTKAIDDGEAKKDAQGKITLDFKIGTNGKAKNIVVDRTNIESQQFQDCVMDVVAKITFPTLEKDLDWSYTYAFEAF
jgi:hypothetical protein